MDTIPPHAYEGNSSLLPVKASGIYKITCTANKKIYLGSAVNLRQRRNRHFLLLRRNQHSNPHLQNAWNKYGEQAFTFEVLELVLPISLTAREQYWFRKLKPFGKRGFNIAREAGSSLGIKRSSEYREKQRQSHPKVSKKRSSEANKGNRQGRTGWKHTSETIEKIKQAHAGKRLTPEHREKIGQANRGKKRSPEHIEKIRQAKIGKGGYKRSLEAVEKQRRAILGSKLSPESLAKRRQKMIDKKRIVGDEC